MLVKLNKISSNTNKNLNKEQILLIDTIKRF